VYQSTLKKMKLLTSKSVLSGLVLSLASAASALAQSTLPPDNRVPEGGSTLPILSLALVGLAVVWKLKRK
jgi:hypothetical protein